jgi:hypothetical protein
MLPVATYSITEFSKSGVSLLLSGAGANRVAENV